MSHRLVHVPLAALSVSVSVSLALAGLAACSPQPAAGPVIGEVQAEPTSPFQATLTVELRAPASVAAACVRRDAPDEVHLVEGTGEDTVVLRFAGLRAATDYDCTVGDTDAAGEPTAVALRTDDPPFELVSADVVDHPAFEATGDYTVMTVRPECFGIKQDYIAVLDPAGEPRWRYDLPLGLNIGVEVRSDGKDRFLWGGGDDPRGAPTVVDVRDGPSWAVAFPGSEHTVFHHDAKRLPDGRVLSVEATDALGWEAFQLRLTDPSGATSWLWNAETAVATGFLDAGSPDNPDPHHLNWADVVDAGDGPIAYASLCYSRLVIAIDVSTGAPLWRFGAGGDFALVDAQGAPLPDSEFPQCQHGLQTDGTHLLVYDNGLDREVTRAVEYTLDVERGVATRTWIWGDDGFYEPYHGGMDWLDSDHHRILVAEANNDCGGTSDRHSQIVELDRPTGAVVQRMTLRDIGHWIYRAHRVDGCALFDDVRRCDALAERLAELGPALGR